MENNQPERSLGLYEITVALTSVGLFAAFILYIILHNWELFLLSMGWA